MTYAILTDLSSSRATATNVTTDPETAADRAKDLGDNHTLAVVPADTDEGQRVRLALCMVYEDAGLFLAQHA